MSLQPDPPEQPGWMEDVRRRLVRRARPEPLDETDLKRAAVLLPLFVRKGALWILLTRRTETVEHHRGQISFPGGAEEPDDRSLLETAVRESEEEIGLKRQDAIPLGSLSPMKTVTSFYVEPFVAAIPQPYVFRPQESEIAEIIEAPLAALADPAILERKPYPGRPEPVLFYHYGRHTIWGATARMLAELLEALK
ncbi:MAG TPA: CoA pyrophosphatase [Thermoanaerobaculia bacterium]|nr:CoA pyrophosphatase [Thermoanaerobaculia bacterium]